MNDRTTEELNFEATSTIVEELGRNLYSADNSIIVELIANSYDADATEVKIKFESNFIQVTDNGWGMTDDIIKNFFLKAGAKNSERRKSNLGRTTLGRKGIGKLSFFALGDKIEVFTMSDYDLINKRHFELDYNRLVNGNNGVSVITTSSELETFNSGTSIKISNLVSDVFSEKFFEKMIIGISQVFKKLVSNNFKIIVELDKFVFDKKSYCGSFEIKSEEPDFSNTLVFYSFDKETDKQIEKIKNDSKSHLHEMNRLSNNVGIDKISYYYDSNETMNFLKTKEKYNELEKNLLTGKQFEIRGYLASIVSKKAITNNEDESKQNNDSILFKDNAIIFKQSNRKIAIYSKGRNGMLNAKGSLGLADKFYTKYLYGEIDADMFEDPQFGNDISLPNREGYKTNDKRWIFVKEILRLCGDKAMNFSNEIAKYKIEIQDEKSKSNFDSIIMSFKEKAELLETKEDIQELAMNKLTEFSRIKHIPFNLEYNTFVLISYTSHSEYSKKASEIFAKMLQEIWDKYNPNSRILYTNASEIGINGMGKKSDEKLYLLIRNEFIKNPRAYSKFHLFAFVDEKYIKCWATSFEWGMGYATTDLSNHELPIDITTFIPKNSKKNGLLDEFVKNTPLEYDLFETLNEDWISRDIKKILKKLDVNYNNEIDEILKKYYKDFSDL